MLTDQDKDAIARRPVPEEVVRKVFALDRNYEDLRRAAFLALAAGTLAEARASLTAALERELKEV